MSLWIPVVAALGASLLTFLGTWLIDERRRRSERQHVRLESRRRAYMEFLTATNGTPMLGQSLRLIMIAESGLSASLGGALRLKKTPDIHELIFRSMDQIRPILDAQAGVLACGTVNAAEAAMKVVAAVTDYVGVATKMSTAQRALRGLVPWKPNSRQRKTLQVRLEAVGKAFGEFVAVVREELGEDALPQFVSARTEP